MADGPSEAAANAIEASQDDLATSAAPCPQGDLETVLLSLNTQNETHQRTVILALDNELPPNPWVSLGDALSWLAWDKVLNHDRLPFELRDYSVCQIIDAAIVKDCEKATEQQLDTALDALVRAAQEGKVCLMGRPKSGRPGEQADRDYRRVSESELLSFRCFQPIDDTLIDGEGLEWHRDFEESFKIRREFFQVKVRRKDMLSAFGAIEVQAFSEDELKEWMLENVKLSADAAFTMYRYHPRYNKIKKEQFRVLWRAVIKRPRGRPRNFL